MAEEIKQEIKSEPFGEEVGGIHEIMKDDIIKRANDVSGICFDHDDISQIKEEIKQEIKPEPLDKDNIDILTHSEVNEEETIDWIADKSDKKYLITDHLTVTGFEFDTVIIVADEELKNEISNLCQRAKSKLILCCFSENV